MAKLSDFYRRLLKSADVIHEQDASMIAETRKPEVIVTVDPAGCTEGRCRRMTRVILLELNNTGCRPSRRNEYLRKLCSTI